MDGFAVSEVNIARLFLKNWLYSNCCPASIMWCINFLTDMQIFFHNVELFVGKLMLGIRKCFIYWANNNNLIMKIQFVFFLKMRTLKTSAQHCICRIFELGRGSGLTVWGLFCESMESWQACCDWAVYVWVHSWVNWWKILVNIPAQVPHTGLLCMHRE